MFLSAHTQTCVGCYMNSQTYKHDILVSANCCLNFCKQKMPNFTLFASCTNFLKKETVVKKWNGHHALLSLFPIEHRSDALQDVCRWPLAPSSSHTWIKNLLYMISGH
ncbi:hypothetical protein CEXT_46171 [Caerostris extrusa]|uniref:Uncharacterized protein n=1 Tax=Caerostris extrusa TaxID=172846 RepID=A0AAV4RJG0_CAEEX|nr:hypothetical protein CEXT_46171 [Caerostris extrusa]